MAEINLGIVEDDKTIRLSLSQFIDINPIMSLSFACSSVEDLIASLDTNNVVKPDIMLLDIGLPGISGLEAIPQIRKRLPSTDIVMLTTYDDTDTIFKALSFGARSYISKKTSLKDIMEAIHIVYRGGSYMSPSIARRLVDHLQGNRNKNLNEELTQRQLEIVSCLSNGLSYKLIANNLDISIDTVRAHIKKIYRTLEVNSKIEVINLFRKGN